MAYFVGRLWGPVLTGLAFGGGCLPCVARAAEIPPRCQPVLDAMNKLPKLKYVIAIQLDGKDMGTIAASAEDGVSELRKQAQESKTFTCDPAGAEIVDGQKAAVFQLISQSEKRVIQMHFYIAETTGLPLLNVSAIASSAGNHSLQQRFLYSP